MRSICEWRKLVLGMVALVNFGLLAACGGGSAAISGWSGIKQLGVAGKGTFANSVATDASSNVFVVGYTYGGLDGNTLTGTSDLFVAKFNSAGVKQ